MSWSASSDAACCATLGRRSRGDDHRQAAALLREIVDGDRAAKALLDLLNLKDTAQYGLIPITQRELTTALRRAKHLLDFAGDEVAAGKRLRKDERAGKATFVSLLGPDRARHQCAMLIDQAIEHLHDHGEEADLLRAVARFVEERDR